MVTFTEEILHEKLHFLCIESHFKMVFKILGPDFRYMGPENESFKRKIYYHNTY